MRPAAWLALAGLLFVLALTFKPVIENDGIGDHRAPPGTHRRGGRSAGDAFHLLPRLRAELLPHLLRVRGRRISLCVVVAKGQALSAWLVRARSARRPDGPDPLPGRSSAADRPSRQAAPLVASVAVLGRRVGGFRAPVAD